MTLKLYLHPLSSFCQKVLIALYENETPFEPHLVNLGDPAERAEFLKVWPVGKFPVLQDSIRDWMVPESSIIIEYLAQHYPGKVQLVPKDADLARQVRMRDRFFDLYVQVPMQKVMGDELRPQGQRDPFGVEQAMAQLQTALTLVEEDIGAKVWAMGDTFTMTDCSAAPALFYANRLLPLAKDFPGTNAYFERLMKRPSYAHALKDAEPYFKNIPR